MASNQYLEFIDLCILIGGGALVFALVAMTAMGRFHPPLHQLPPGPAHNLEAIDFIAAFGALMVLPAFADRLLAIVWQVPAHPDSDKLIDPRQVAALTVGQSASVGCLFLIARARFAGGLSGWGLTMARPLVRVGQAALGYVAVAPVCLLTLLATVFCIRLVDPAFEPQTHTSLARLSEPGTPRWLMVLTIFNAMILASVVEEAFFRGIMQPFIAKFWRSPWSGILGSAVLFGAFHYPLIDTIPPLTVFGILLGWLYARTGSLTLAISLHALFNAKTLLWLLLEK